MYLLAIVLPPLAVLLCGKPFQAIINIPLTMAAYLPGIAHAILVVSQTRAERQHRELIRCVAAPRIAQQGTR